MSIWVSSQATTFWNHKGLGAFTSVSDGVGGLRGIVQTYRSHVCAAIPDYKTLSFYLDAVYGILITIIPLLIITVFNLLILRALISKRDITGSPGSSQSSHTSHRNSSGSATGNAAGSAAKKDSPSAQNRTVQREKYTREVRLRLEFTMILLSVSTSFICLNLPFFVIWMQHFLISAQQQSNNFIVDKQDYDGVQTKSGLIALAKTIFYFNYCINFFLYALTGRQFRLHLKSLFSFSKSQSANTPVKVMHTVDSIRSEAYGTFNQSRVWRLSKKDLSQIFANI